MRWFAAALIAGALLVPASEARAYEDQISLGVDLGYANIQRGAPASGAGLGVSVGVGLGDTFTLKFRGGYALHPGSALTTTHALSATVDALYIVDILTWVPFFGAGIDGHLLIRDGSAAGNFEVHGIVGLDYLHSRTLAIGLDVRVGVLPFEPTPDVFRGLHIRAGLRVAWLFSTW